MSVNLSCTDIFWLKFACFKFFVVLSVSACFLLFSYFNIGESMNGQFPCVCCADFNSFVLAQKNARLFFPHSVNNLVCFVESLLSILWLSSTFMSFN